MRLLLDTHIYLWWLQDSPRLDGRAAEAIADPSSLVCISAASIWEASIKSALGRLGLGGVDLVGEVVQNGFVDLDVTAAHAWSAGQLPAHHRDPFDRLLVTQAQQAQLLLVTDDEALERYDVAILGR